MADPSAHQAMAPPRVRLLETFGLDIAGREVVLPVHAQRVLAYLALTRTTWPAHQRTVIADRLWGDGPHKRAQASLRTALWRIRQADRHLVQADREHVRLDLRVAVDVERSLDQAARLLANGPELTAGDSSTAGLTADLLPGWEEDWLLVERERIRQVRIHALVALAHRLCRLGRFLPALDAAYSAIAAEPLHEAAHGALIEVHLAEGDLVQARRQVDQYAQLLWAEMRLRPSAALLALVPAPAMVRTCG